MSTASISGTIAGSRPLSLGFNVATPPLLMGRSILPCAGRASLFFPPTYRNWARVREACALCDTCPVVRECLAWAVARPDLDGIWGGTTPPQRRRIRTGKI
jgi:WhiB family redox-sensing transcriptional regulator